MMMLVPTVAALLLLQFAVVSGLKAQDHHRTVDDYPAYEDLDLGGKNQWTASNSPSGNGNVTTHTTKVPGDIYGDLMDAKVIGNPFYRYGDMNYRWMAYDNWTYTRSFEFRHCHELTGDTSARIDLVVEGMQTISSIYVSATDGSNRSLVGSTRDEFQKYVFSLENQLQTLCSAQPSGGHTNSLTVNLTVALESSVTWATQRYEEYRNCTLDNGTAYFCPFASGFLTGLPHRNFIRTEQSSFGWDWSCAFAPQGIYKPIYVRRYTFKPVQRSTKADSFVLSGSLDYVTPHLYHLPRGQRVEKPIKDRNNSFELEVWAFPTISQKQGSGVSINDHCWVKVEIYSEGGRSHGTLLVSKREHVGAQNSENAVVVTLNVTNVDLWWPNGYGRQTLYDTYTSLYCVSTKTTESKTAEKADVLLDSAYFKYGFRSIELITYGDPLKYSQEVGPGTDEDAAATGEDGTVRDRPVMFFRVNGVPMFAKGANLVPFDAFQSRVNDTFMEDILDSAVDAHMNLVRVWGGGLFPLDRFYEMAQEKGVMLWQEMIFADSSYPIDDTFLESVRGEITHQMRRLGRHTAIAVWSGNNEDALFFRHGNGVYPYDVLNNGNVLHTIFREDNSRPVWPSSPSTGFGSGMTPSGLPSGSMLHPEKYTIGGDSGDTHFYDYFTCPNVSVYPKTNFGSEYGFQSLPNFPSFEKISEPEDWSLFSQFMYHRQHHPQGNAEIAALLKQNFQIPNLTSTALPVFKRVIYLSQIQQLLCIADEGSYYRRGRNMPYRTMGSLYWQLNQNWEAPSWTSIDFGGVWKPLHYAMSDVYQSLHMSAFHNRSTDLIVAHLASDQLEPTRHWNITIELIPFTVTAAQAATDQFVVTHASIDTLPALSGTFFYNTVKRTELLAQHSTRCPKGGASCFLYFRAQQDTHHTGHPSLPVPNRPFWLDEVRTFTLVNTTSLDIKVTSVDPSGLSAKVEVSIAQSSSGVAPYVVLNTDSYYGRFSYNSFLLIPGRTATLDFTLRKVLAFPDSGGYKTSIASAQDLESSLYAQFLNQMWSG